MKRKVVHQYHTIKLRAGKNLGILEKVCRFFGFNVQRLDTKL